MQGGVIDISSSSPTGPTSTFWKNRNQMHPSILACTLYYQSRSRSPAVFSIKCAKDNVEKKAAMQNRKRGIWNGGRVEVLPHVKCQGHKQSNTPYSGIHTSKWMGSTHEIPSRSSFFWEKWCIFFYSMFLGTFVCLMGFQRRSGPHQYSIRKIHKYYSPWHILLLFFWPIYGDSTGKGLVLVFSYSSSVLVSVLVVFRGLLEDHAVNSPLLLPGSCSHS